MRPIWLRLVSAVAMLAVVAVSSAQQAVSLPKQATEVREKALAMRPGERISVSLLSGDEAFGALASAGETSMTFHDVDKRADVTVMYAEVRKLKQGYGGYNSVTHRHTDRHRNIVIAAITGAALVGLIVLATTAKN